MVKNVKKRLKESYRAKTPKGRKRQTEGRRKRWLESSKTGPAKLCKIKEENEA